MILLNKNTFIGFKVTVNTWIMVEKNIFQINGVLSSTTFLVLTIMLFLEQ